MEPTEAATRSRVPRVAALLMIVALVAGVATIVVGGFGSGDDPEPWDERLASLVEFVEDERGLDFEHAVRTEFLSPAEFRDEVTDDDALAPDEAEDLAHLEGVFRALGLVRGELDLRAAVNQLSGEGILGLYDPDDDRILVRGDRLTPEIRATVVHELTHALQAQHFGLDLERETGGEELAFRALVEADALRVERAYLESLPEDERSAAHDQQRARAEAADFEGVPRILTELFALPYAFGPPLLATIEADGGEEAVDEAFRRPPTTEEHLLHPHSYLEGEEAVDVEAPTLGPGEEAVDEPEDFGMLSLLLVLGERVPFPLAWAAVDGWAGDASVSYTAEGRDCIRIRTRLDSDEDADELLAATRRWVGDRRTASTARHGDVVELESCDPGTGTTDDDNNDDDGGSRPRPFELVQLRTELQASLEASGLDHDTATCAADTILRDNEPAELLEINTVQDPDDPRLVALQRRVVATVERCGART